MTFLWCEFKYFSHHYKIQNIKLKYIHDVFFFGKICDDPKQKPLTSRIHLQQRSGCSKSGLEKENVSMCEGAMWRADTVNTIPFDLRLIQTSDWVFEISALVTWKAVLLLSLVIHDNKSIFLTEEILVVRENKPLGASPLETAAGIFIIFDVSWTTQHQSPD